MSKRKKKPKKLNSRAKGAAGERELAKRLDGRGLLARRGQQFSGGSESPDVVCPALAAYHIECKRTEKGALYEWMAQSERDAGEAKRPIVIHRRNDKDWVVIMKFDDFIDTVMGIV